MKKNYEEIIKTETTYGSKTKGIKKIFKTFAMLGTSAVLAFGALGLVGCNNKNDNGNINKPPIIDQPVIDKPIEDFDNENLKLLLENIKNWEISEEKPQLPNTFNNTIYKDLIKNINWEDLKDKEIDQDMPDPKYPIKLLNYCINKNLNFENKQTSSTSSMLINLGHPNGSITKKNENNKSQTTLDLKELNFNAANSQSICQSIKNQSTNNRCYIITMLLKDNFSPAMDTDYDKITSLLSCNTRHQYCFIIDCDTGYLLGMQKQIYGSGTVNGIGVYVQFQENYTQIFSQQEQTFNTNNLPTTEETEIQ